MNVIVTGATGFVGSHLLQLLVKQNRSVTAVSRARIEGCPFNLRYHVTGGIGANTNWENILPGVNVVIHLAARAHVMNDQANDPLAEFRKVNVDGTLNFARQSAKYGVKRFIFISSVKVNGEVTEPGKPFTETIETIPSDPYGLSKYEAEQGLAEIASETGMEVVIIRPPLVYGPGVKANFKVMMKWVSLGVPLPLGAINNRRSLLSLDNLVDFISVCIEHPEAANQTFLVSDDHDLSTTELSKLLGDAFGRPALLIPIPVSWIKFAATLIGKSTIYQRLCSSLQVDISKAKTMLGWQPPVSVEEGIRKAVTGFLDEKSH